MTLIDPTATVAFLPCLMGNHRLWQAQVRVLEGKRALHFADFSQQESIEAMAQDVLAQTRGPLVLAGLSLGGYVAFEIWRQAPGRVVAMILANTSARSEVAQQTTSRQALMARVRGGWSMDQLCRAIMPFLVYRRLANDTALVEGISEMARTLGPEVFHRQQHAIMQRRDSRPDLPQITCPVLVVGGIHDTITPLECQHEMMASLPNSEMLTLDCGHMSAMELPNELNRAIGAFLELD